MAQNGIKTNEKRFLEKTKIKPTKYTSYTVMILICKIIKLFQVLCTCVKEITVVCIQLYGCKIPEMLLGKHYKNSLQINTFMQWCLIVTDESNQPSQATQGDVQPGNPSTTTPGTPPTPAMTTNNSSSSSHNAAGICSRSILKPLDIASSTSLPPCQQIDITFLVMYFSSRKARSFNADWFKLYPWLEYSINKDAALATPVGSLV